MTNDIVARLRSKYICCENQNDPLSMCLEAATEIERLRAELAESKNVQTLGDVFKRIAELKHRAEEHTAILRNLTADSR